MKIQTYDINLLTELYLESINSIKESFNNYKEWLLRRAINTPPKGTFLIEKPMYDQLNSSKIDELKNHIKKYRNFKKVLLETELNKALNLIDRYIILIKKDCKMYFKDFPIYGNPLDDTCQLYENLIDILISLYSARIAINIEINFRNG